MRQCLMHYAAGVLCFFILLTGCTQQSTQPGQSKWQPFNSGLPQNVSVLTIDQSVKAPQVLYIGTFSGVYKRLPGSDWTSVQSGLPLKHISAVAVHPQNADLVFCGTWGRGLYRSENGGDSWENIWPDAASPHISHILLSGSDYRQVWVGTENGIYHSRDRGDTWQHAMTFGSVKTISVHPMNPDIIFAGVDIKGNYKSTDGGQTWSLINEGVHSNGESTAAANSFVFQTDPSNTLYMSTGWVDVYTSDTAGNSSSKTGDLLTELNVQRLIQDPAKPEHFWAATQYDGVYVSNNSAVSWQSMNNGLPHAEGNRIRIHDLILGSGGDRALYTGLNSYGIYKYALD